MSGVRIGWFARLAGAWLLSACGATVDPLGSVPPGAPPDDRPAFDSDSLSPLAGPASYPNPLRDELGKTDAEIASRLEELFEQLFHGDPASQAIYFTVGDDQAYIQDVFHGDTRSEGMGLGMLIALELDRREEHDRLWRFAAEGMRYREGPNRGYLRSTCTDGPCADPFGQQVLATALLFAHGRWGSRTGDIDYGAEALALLHAMRHRPSDGADVTAMIDATTQLPVDEPSGEGALRTRPANVMPAFYELWAQATADASWVDVAEAGRELLRASAHPTSGLWPTRAEFDGSAVPGSDTFMPDGYRVLLHTGLDHAWFDASPWYVEESDRLVDFFTDEGLELYGSSYELDGSACIGCGRNMALVAMNGVSALAATRAERTAFFEAVWNLQLTEGQFRYYDGLLHVLSLLVLGGQLRVY